MVLGKTLQLVLQVEKPQGGYSCEGFAGIPVTHPCFIVLASDGTDISMERISILGNLIRQELLRLPGVTNADVPCGGAIATVWKCHAHRTPYCCKLLVLVGDGVAPLPNHADFDQWLEKGDTYFALPIVPKSAEPELGSILREKFRRINARFFTDTIADVVPDILSAVGLTRENRVFISYCRHDTEKLADQIFVALTEMGYDVFLDRFRVPPAIDFQERLTQELAEKSMVILLESENFLESEWVQYEVEFAVEHRLGLYAIQVPGGRHSKGITDEYRRYLLPTEFANGEMEILDQATLGDVVNRVRLAHWRKMIWRRKVLQESMIGGLDRVGLNSQIGSTGIIGVKAVDPRTGNDLDYSIRVTPRPPQLEDFHDTHIEVKSENPSRTCFVVGPVTSQEHTARRHLSWLGAVSEIGCFDEGKMIEVAEMIKACVL